MNLHLRLTTSLKEKEILTNSPHLSRKKKFSQKTTSPPHFLKEKDKEQTYK